MITNPQSDLSRRDALRTAGVGSAVALLGGPTLTADAAAATRPAGTALPINGSGFYRFEVGNVRVHLISDGTFPFDPVYPLFGGNASEQLVKQALDDAFVAPPVGPLGHVNTLLLDVAGQLVLIDVGCGTAFGPDAGHTPGRLATLGVDPGDVRHVILTHLHGDHIGGLLVEGDPYPNAQFHLHTQERAFWSAPQVDLSKSGIPADVQGPMIEAARSVLRKIAGRTSLVEADREVLPPLRVTLAAGHTPGHVVVELPGFLYLSDMLHFPAIQLQNPGWYVAYDTDRDAAALQRRATLTRAADGRLLCAGSHVPFPGVGNLRRSGEGFTWVPTIWKW